MLEFAGLQTFLNTSYSNAINLMDLKSFSSSALTDSFIIIIIFLCPCKQLGAIFSHYLQQNYKSSDSLLVKYTNGKSFVPSDWYYDMQYY